MQTSKISHFPRRIREELNERLDRSEKQKRILDWVNSLPEVQAVLKEDFEGELVNKTNLTKWKQNGFRNWQLHQSVLAFTNDALPEDLDPSVLDKMSAKLMRHYHHRAESVIHYKHQAVFVG